jgi:peptidoglycan/xylan/chitin deacetylase (PgdA/CDA1 family)
MQVCFTVDVEQDCPPYLTGWRGLEEGMPLLLDLLAAERVRATFFATGESARRYPAMIDRAVRAGHELGCHGDRHIRFDRVPLAAARADIDASSVALRRHAEVRSFRAPYLKFPAAYLPLLEQAGYGLDSSEARYKSLQVGVTRVGALTRIPASVTSSLLRLPASLRNGIFAQLDDPVVLFVHPWEFVDLRRERLRWDCRFRTGAIALQCVRESLRHFAEGGATFRTMTEMVPRERRAA